jgi:arylsulfatase A-like enzyme
VPEGCCTQLDDVTERTVGLESGGLGASTSRRCDARYGNAPSNIIIAERRRWRQRSRGPTSCSCSRHHDHRVSNERRQQMPKTDKPNILVIWGDDIGITNLSCYSSGLMGYHTPNIDRLANEGICFTDSYGEQSCTAGRSSFITGQSCFRTGLSKVGIPGSPIGLQAEDPTIAELLKPLGYATGQFGKNHLGDLNKYLPHRARLRRVLRQPLPPERRGGAGDGELPVREGLPTVQEAVRAARRDPLVGDGQGRRDRRATLGARGQAANRGHRPAHEEAHGDDRRRDDGGGQGLHQAAARRG